MKKITFNDTLALSLHQISREEFLAISDIQSYAELLAVTFECIKNAVSKKDAHELELGMSIIGLFDLEEDLDDQFSDVLMEAMRGDWHFQHENIALTFEFGPKPQYVDVLYETTQRQLQYLAFDDCYALAVKCIWALGKIGTKEAKEKLKRLAQSENGIIKKNAEQQLSSLLELN